MAKHILKLGVDFTSPEERKEFMDKWRKVDLDEDAGVLKTSAAGIAAARAILKIESKNDWNRIVGEIMKTSHFVGGIAQAVEFGALQEFRTRSLVINSI